jgi:hypothetical protein
VAERSASDDQPRKDRPGLRRWLAIGISTVLLFFSYLMFVFGFSLATDDEERVFAGGVIGIALGLVPGVFMCLAAISQREHAVRTTLLATLLWVVIGGPIAILDIPTGLVAGFGAGGVVALHREPAHTTVSRALVVAICVLYVFVLGRVVPAAALMVGAILPFAAVGVADSFMEREATAAADAG